VSFVVSFAEFTFLVGGVVFMLALCLAALATLRLAIRGGAVTSLMGISCFTTVAGTALYLLEVLFHIHFARDTAIALLMIGAIGTIVFARILRRGGGE